MTFRILTLCTGNICRSPVAERVISTVLQDLRYVEVESAGTAAMIGHGLPAEADELARQRSLDLSDHRGRQLSVDVVNRSDLILGMTREHRRAAATLVPNAARRSFTLIEFSRISDLLVPQLHAALEKAESGEEAMFALTDLAASMRGLAPPPDAQEDLDIVDPYGRSRAIYRRSFEQLLPAATKTASFIRLAAETVSAS